MVSSLFGSRCVCTFVFIKGVSVCFVVFPSVPSHLLRLNNKIPFPFFPTLNSLNPGRISKFSQRSLAIIKSPQYYFFPVNNKNAVLSFLQWYKEAWGNWFDPKSVAKVSDRRKEICTLKAPSAAPSRNTGANWALISRIPFTDSADYSTVLGDLDLDLCCGRCAAPKMSTSEIATSCQTKSMRVRKRFVRF